jgi:hypothetical protein
LYEINNRQLTLSIDELRLNVGIFLAEELSRQLFLSDEAIKEVALGVPAAQFYLNVTLVDLLAELVPAYIQELLNHRLLTRAHCVTNDEGLMAEGVVVRLSQSDLMD